MVIGIIYKYIEDNDLLEYSHEGEASEEISDLPAFGLIILRFFSLQTQ